MGDNAGMTTQQPPDDPTQELDALESALTESDPADAPDPADSIADRLNVLLDATANEPLDEDAL